MKEQIEIEKEKKVMFNTIHITIYKSGRKNSVARTVDINNHYELSDERAIDKIDEATEQIINAQKKMNTKKLIISASISKQVFETSPHSNYDRNFIALNLQKNEYFSIEQVINNIYYALMFCNPNLTLDIRKLHENPSVRYTINKFYHG